MIPVLYNDKSECCGCSACAVSCPKEAIDMQRDEQGFLYPRIDEKKCIDCKTCIKVCPLKKNSV